MDQPPYPGPPNPSSYSFPTSQEPFSTAPFASILGHLPLQYQRHQQHPQHQRQYVHPTRVHVQALKRPGVYQDSSRYVQERMEVVGAGVGSREDGAKSRFSGGYYGDHPAVYASRTPGTTFNPDPTQASNSNAHQNVDMKMYRTHAGQTMKTQAYPHLAHSRAQPQPVLMPHQAPSQPLSVATNFAEWARNLPSPPPWTRQTAAAGGTGSSESGDGLREDGRWNRSSDNGDCNDNVDAYAITEAGVQAGMQVDNRQGPARRQAGCDVSPSHYAFPGDLSTHSAVYPITTRAGTRTSTPAPTLDLLAQISTSTLPGHTNLLSSQPLSTQTPSTIFCRCGGGSGSNPVAAPTCTCLSEHAGASALMGLMTTAPHPSVHLSYASASTSGHGQVQPQMQMQTRTQMKARSLSNTQSNLVGWNDMDVSTSATVAMPSMIEMESRFQGGSAQSQFQSNPSVGSTQIAASRMASGMDMGMGQGFELNTSSSPDTDRKTTPSAEVNPIVVASSEAQKCLDPFPHGLYGVKSWKSNGSDSQSSDQVRSVKDALSGVDETFLLGKGNEAMGVQQSSLQRNEPPRDKGRSRANRSVSSMSLKADIGWPGEDGLSAPVPYYQLDDFFQDQPHDWQRQLSSLDTGKETGNLMPSTSAPTPGCNPGQSAMATPAASCSGTSALSGWNQNPSASILSQKWDDPAMIYQLDMIKTSKGKGEKVSSADLSAAYIHQCSGTMQTTLAGSSLSTPNLASSDPTSSSSILDVANRPRSIPAGSTEMGDWAGQIDYGFYAPSTSQYSEHVPTLTDGSSVETSWSCSTPWGVKNADALVAQAGPLDADFDVYSSGLLDTSEMEETDDNKDIVLPEPDASLLPMNVRTPMMLYRGADAIEDASFSPVPAAWDASNADVAAYYESVKAMPNALQSGQPEDKASNISDSSPAVAVNHNKPSGSVAQNNTSNSGVIPGKVLECENCKTTTTALWGKGPADEVLCNLCSVASQLKGKRRDAKSKELQRKNKVLEEESGTSANGDSALTDSPFDGAICEDQQEPPAGTDPSRQVFSSTSTPSSSKFLITTVKTGRPARIGKRRTTKPPGTGRQSPRGTDKSSRNVVQTTPELVSSPTPTACDQLALTPMSNPVTKNSPITTRTRAKRTLPEDTTPSNEPIAPPKKQRKKKATKPKN